MIDNLWSVFSSRKKKKKKRFLFFLFRLKIFAKKKIKNLNKIGRKEKKRTLSEKKLGFMESFVSSRNERKKKKERKQVWVRLTISQNCAIFPLFFCHRFSLSPYAFTFLTALWWMFGFRYFLLFVFVFFFLLCFFFICVCLLNIIEAGITFTPCRFLELVFFCFTWFFVSL